MMSKVKVEMSKAKDRAIELSKDRAAKDRVADQLVAAINPRFSDYNFPRIFSLLVGICMFAAFIGLLVSNATCYDVVRSTSELRSTTGNWLQQRYNLEGAATRPSELPSSVSWEASICVVSAWRPFVESMTVGWGSNSRTTTESGLRSCILFPPEWTTSRSFPSYFDGCNYEDLPVAAQVSLGVALASGGVNVVPDVSTGNMLEYWHAYYETTTPGWRAIFSCVDTSHPDCGTSPAFQANATRIRDSIEAGNQDYVYCGVDMRLANWFDPAQAAEVPRWDWNVWNEPILTAPRTQGAQGRTEVHGSLPNFQLDFVVTHRQSEEICPSMTGAIGAALGWMGIVEFGATLLLFVLLRSTILHPIKKDASFLNLLRGAGLSEAIAEVKEAIKEAILPGKAEATAEEEENEARGQEALDNLSSEASAVVSSTLSSEASAVVSSTSSQTPVQTISVNSAHPIGATLKQQGDNVVIAKVDAGTPAAKVPVGSRVIAVNETSCIGQSKDDVIGAIKAAKAAAPSFSLTVDTSGTEAYDLV